MIWSRHVNHATGGQSEGRAFCIAGPKLWNDLPLEIRKCASVATFRQSLKTFLFKLAYRL